MKVCVGNRTFNDAVIGSARDELRACIDVELNQLAQNVGLVVENVAVPEVIILAGGPGRLDEIVQSRLQTEKAAQDELRAKAQAAAEQALQEGQIRVEQSRLQEETRQKVLLAQLEEERLAAQQKVIQAERQNELARVEAEKAVIEAQKANELVFAQLDLEVQAIRAEAAELSAQADTSVQRALASLYTQSPGLLSFHIAQENAAALANTEKAADYPRRHDSHSGDSRRVDSVCGGCQYAPVSTGASWDYVGRTSANSWRLTLTTRISGERKQRDTSGYCPNSLSMAWA